MQRSETLFNSLLLFSSMAIQILSHRRKKEFFIFTKKLTLSASYFGWERFENITLSAVAFLTWIAKIAIRTIIIGKLVTFEIFRTRIESITIDKLGTRIKFTILRYLSGNSRTVRTDFGIITTSQKVCGATTKNKN
jgi:hypothetical protein